MPIKSHQRSLEKTPVLQLEWKCAEGALSFSRERARFSLEAVVVPL